MAGNLQGSSALLLHSSYNSPGLVPGGVWSPTRAFGTFLSEVKVRVRWAGDDEMMKWVWVNGGTATPPAKEGRGKVTHPSAGM